MRYGLLVVAALLPAGAVAAETYHIAPGGNDANDGSAGSPWRTLQHAADTVAAGDTVQVAAGSYAGFVMETDGRAGAEIAFVGAAGARITSSAPAGEDGINLEGASFIRVEGFTVTGATRDGIRAVTCEHVTIRNNVVVANGFFGIFTGFCDDLLIENNEVARQPTEHGVYVSNSGDRPVLRNNVIYSNAKAGIHMNGDVTLGGDGIISDAVVELNNIYDNGGNGGASGINCDGVQDSIFRNNLLFANHASGISLYREDGGGASTGNLVVNNTIVMASDGRWAINVQNASGRNRYRNNILLSANSRTGAFDMSADSVTGTVSDHNAGVGRFSLAETEINLAAWRSMTGLDGDYAETTEAAIFTTVPGQAPADFVPRAGGPAVDHGTATDAPPMDLAGNARPQGDSVDLGALERCDGPCMEPPPGGSDAGTGGPGDPDAGGGGGGGRDAGGGGGGGGGDGGGSLNGGDGEITGGCCDTGDAGRSGSGVLLLGGAVAAALGLRRRRRA